MIYSYDHLSHGDALKEWLMFYKLPLTHLNEIPALGVVAEDEEGLIAAGFIRKIENCNYALLDGLIANPESSGKRRYYAIDAVVGKLIEESENLGLKRLIAFSVDAGTLKRSQRHGFLPTGNTVITLDL